MDILVTAAVLVLTMAVVTMVVPALASLTTAVVANNRIIDRQYEFQKKLVDEIQASQDAVAKEQERRDVIRQAIKDLSATVH